MLSVRVELVLVPGDQHQLGVQQLADEREGILYAGGRGFSLIKRAPAYTFGMKLKDWPVSLAKPPQFNTCGMTRKGRHTVPQGIIAEHCGGPGDKTQKPGPGKYYPDILVTKKRPPAYTMRIAGKPPYQPWDMWTPSSNMYWPPIPGKRNPAYTFPYIRPSRKEALPGPGAHDPKFEYVMSTKPAFSLGYRFREGPKKIVPAPNAYCQKRLLYSKRSAPAPSFGIKHTKYLGKTEVYEAPSSIQAQNRQNP